MYGYGYDYYNPFAGILKTYSAGIVIAIIAVWVFVASLRWKLFVKAGEAGWKSLIPFYGDFVEYGLVWETKWFWIDLVCGLIGGALAFIPLIGITLAIAATLLKSLIGVIFKMQKTHAFGKDDGFALGLILLPTPFEILLAYDKGARYVGPQPTPEFVNEIKKDPNPFDDKPEN